MRVLCSLFPCVAVTLMSSFVEAIDYKDDVLPVMKAYCWDCHSNDTKVKGNLALDDLEEMRLYQVGKYNLIRPGNAKESNFLERMLLPPGHNDFMPRKGEALPKEKIDLIAKWIDAGAVIDRENPSEDELPFVKGAMKSGDGEAEYLSWQSSDGKTIEARFRGLEGEAVKIATKEGKSYTVPFERLKPESVEQAKRLGAGE